MKFSSFEICKLTRADIRSGADKLHEALDGKVCLPDCLCVMLVGVIGGILPFAIGWLYKGSIL